MKIIPLGSRYINTDKVVMLNSENKLFMDGNVVIQLNDEEVQEFVKMYNLVNTDEWEVLLLKVSKVLLNHPVFMTRAGIEAEIKLNAERYDLKSFITEYNKINHEGRKLKELNEKEIVSLHRAMIEKINEGDLPY